MAKKNVLWPYGTPAALVAMVAAWLSFAAILLVLRNYAGWPSEASVAPLLSVVIALSLVPLALELVDYIAGSRAIVGIAGVTLDFSKGEAWNVTRPSIELPKNIGPPQPLISDASAMQIAISLSPTTVSEVVRLDLGTGDEWWVTRLLVFAAGAVRVGSPKAFVFVGMKHNLRGAFLGWARPAALLDALRSVEPKTKPPAPQPLVTYGQIYDKAINIARRVTMFAGLNLAQTFPPGGPPGAVPSPIAQDVQRYLSRPDYVELGDAALEQILMDQLALLHLEHPPDHLTLHRFEEIFSPCLHCDTIDVTHSSEQQVKVFLETEAPYVALVSRGHYEGVVERTAGERAILRQLVMQGSE